VIIHWKDLATISIEEGKKILVDQLPNSDDQVTGFLVVGAGLGILLHQLQRVTLHASAIHAENGAVAFVGGKRMGKSTTAAAFKKLGYPVVTDDILATDVSADGIHVAPGERFFKLYPNSVVSALGIDPNDIPSVHSYTNKRFYSITSDSRRVLPLSCIFLLDYDGDKEGLVPRIEPVSGESAYIELTANSYALRFLGEEGIYSWYIQAMAQIVRSVPVHRLVRGPDIDQLSDFVTCVQQHLERCGDEGGQ